MNLTSGIKTNWVGSKEEQDFFDEYLAVADDGVYKTRIREAMNVVKLGERGSSEYWTAMSILCLEKARRIRQ